MAYRQLKLENQICFPVYAVSRLITRAYQPHLEALGLTYPQYLVLMVLWEADEKTVNEIAEKLVLQTNTITPLLKRMEQNRLIRRARSPEDERKVIITLDSRGKDLEKEAAGIPDKLLESIGTEGISREEIFSMKEILVKLMRQMSAQ